MDHERANAIKAVERYVLRELSEGERDEFEAHFFGCPACAQQVRETVAFVDNAVAVMRSAVPAGQVWRPARRAGWTGWLIYPRVGWAAAGVLLAVAALELAYLRQVRSQLAAAVAPQVVLSTVLHPATRAEADRVMLPRGAAVFELVLDVDPEQPAAHYSYSIQAVSGAVVAAGTAPAPAPGAGLHLLLPRARFADGVYRIQIQPAEGPVGGPIQEYRFRIQLQ